MTSKLTIALFCIIVITIITGITLGPQVFFPEYVYHPSGEFTTKYAKVRYPPNGVNNLHFRIFSFGNERFIDKKPTGLLNETAYKLDSLIEDVADVIEIDLKDFQVNIEILDNDRTLRQICGEPTISFSEVSPGITIAIKGRGCFSNILNNVYVSDESYEAATLIHEVAHKMINMKYGNSITKDEKEARVMGITEWMVTR